jgi:hypothetical protein
LGELKAMFQTEGKMDYYKKLKKYGLAGIKTVKEGTKLVNRFVSDFFTVSILDDFDELQILCILIFF